MPLVATAVLRLFAALKLERLAPRLAAGLMFTPMAVSAGAITIAYGNGLNDTRRPDGLLEPARGRSLWGRLQAGAVPDRPELLPDTQPFAVYRVRS